MSIFKPAFRPACNREGLAKLTFKGVELLSGKKGDINKKGVEYKKDWEILNFVFTCQGVLRGTFKDINMRVPMSYHPENKLGRILDKMGFIPNEPETVFDEDGVESYVVAEEDEDGLEVCDEEFDIGIDAFIESAIGKVYFARVEKTPEGMLTIDVESLRERPKK